jgi:hypothetical protein
MYIKLTDGVPQNYSTGQLRSDNPQVSFPAEIPDSLLVEYGVYPYSRPELPAYDPLTHSVADGLFEQDASGAWVLPWVVEVLSLDRAAANIRRNRDLLLRDTDWIVIKAYERNENIPVEWEVYRQALRDITTQEGFPHSVVWPTKPE